MLDRSLVGFRSILVEWQLKTNFRCHIIWVGPLYTSFLIRGQSAAIRGLDRGGAEGNPRGAAGAGGNPRNPPALQIREARMKRLVIYMPGSQAKGIPASHKATFFHKKEKRPRLAATPHNHQLCSWIDLGRVPL